MFFCITPLSTNSFCEDSTIYNTLAALVGSNACRVVLYQAHKNVWSSTPVLCSESHLIFPWLKSPIIILTSLIALYIFSLFCLVMLGQSNTTPMVTSVCPGNKLHHMASLQSACSCTCSSYDGIVSLMYGDAPPPPSSHSVFPKHYITSQSQFSICYISVCP